MASDAGLRPIDGSFLCSDNLLGDGRYVNIAQKGPESIGVCQGQIPAGGVW